MKGEERFLFPYLRLSLYFGLRGGGGLLSIVAVQHHHSEIPAQMREEHFLIISNILLRTLPVHMYIWSFVDLVV